MENTQDYEQGVQLYRDGVNNCLSGFQLLESQLKSYLDMHFNLTRAILAGRLHFGFHVDDFREAALGRLVQTFSKVCANEDFVRELRAVVRSRDQIAHQALLRLYGAPLEPNELMPLLVELAQQAGHINGLMGKLIAEMDKLIEGVAPDRPGAGA